MGKKGHESEVEEKVNYFFNKFEGGPMRNKGNDCHGFAFHEATREFELAATSIFSKMGNYSQSERNNSEKALLAILGYSLVDNKIDNENSKYFCKLDNEKYLSTLKETLRASKEYKYNANLFDGLSDDEKKLLKYKAFFCLVGYYRRRASVGDKSEGALYKFQQLFDRNNTEFENYKSLELIKFQLELEKIKINKSGREQRQAISNAYKCTLDTKWVSETFRGENDNPAEYPHAGTYHTFADLATTYYEKNNDGIDDNSGKRRDKNFWVEKAIEMIKKAIESSKNAHTNIGKVPKIYAKEYSCLARLYVIQAKDLVKKDEFGRAIKKYEEAIEAIDIAIKNEEPINTVRISDYFKVKFELMSSIADVNLKNTTKDHHNEIKKANNRGLQMFGFFAGLMGIIFTAVNILLQMTPLGAIVVLGAFLGVLIVAFSFFTLLLDDNAKKHILKYILIFAIGFGLIIGAAVVAIIFDSSLFIIPISPENANELLILSLR